MALESAADICQFSLALVTALSGDDPETAITLIRAELGAERNSDTGLVLLAVSALAAQAVERAAIAEMREPAEILRDWGTRLSTTS